MSLRSFGYVLKSAADTGYCLKTKLFSSASVCDVAAGNIPYTSQGGSFEILRGKTGHKSQILKST